jgi:hypothetical protein
MTEVEPTSVGADSRGGSTTSDVGVPASARPGFFARPWVRVAGVGLAVGGIAAIGLPLLVLGPYVSDDLRLDRVVRAVALDWRDFGEERARERLEYELDHQGIGAWVEDDDCVLVTAGEERSVTCAWGVALPVPWTELVLPVTFRSVATIDPSGDIR